jgi:hypothetical protein
MIMNPKLTPIPCILCAVGVSVLMAALLLSSPVFAQESTENQPGADQQDPMTLKGNDDGTVLRSLTIEGEDRIQIEFDRPLLNLEIDGQGIEGLRWGHTMDVVQRQEVDLLSPMVATSTRGRVDAMGRPWLRQFRSGSVARFHPTLDDVARWGLTIADSRGDTVQVFTGKGSPPKEITWDGVCVSGELALPGLTYSYVLEAWDKAGNRRNFVGPGFEVAPYRIERKGSFDLVLSGKTLMGPAAAARPAGSDDPWVLEAASWLNQFASADQTIEIKVLARNYDMADAMGEIVREQLVRHLAGSPVRLRVMTEARNEAPKQGVVTIGVRG